MTTNATPVGPATADGGMTCTWASCTQPATTRADGHPLCAEHHDEHIEQVWHSRRHPAGRPVSAQHGTVSGYSRHVRLGLVPCEQCSAAWAEDATRRRRARGVQPRRQGRAPRKTTSSKDSR